jgi:hypothetical protein
MSLRSPFSTAELMRLVVLVALNLALFQGVWWLLLFPPIGMLVIVLDLTMYAAWVRLRALSRAESVAVFVGLLLVVAMTAYLADERMVPRLTTHLLAALPKALSWRIQALVGPSRLWLLEEALLLVLGTCTMLLAGLAIARLRRGADHRSLDAGSPSP